MNLYLVIIFPIHLKIVPYSLLSPPFNNELIFSDEVDFAKYKFNISPRKNITNIKNKCIEFIENFENPDYKNLLFVGSTGLR
ncbi:hypothetical protein EGR52_12395 [bacterium]|nr:hypothetical protein [bacterium]